MSCGCTRTSGCSSTRCGCTTYTSCSSCAATTDNCNQVCAALIVANSWNIPSCSASAVLSVPGLTSVLIGSFIWNPSYGWFQVTAFDSVNAQVTVLNTCIDGNEIAGSVVPAGTEFVFGTPPSNTNVTYSGYSSGTDYVLTGASAAFVFGTDQASITITQPGTYLILAQVTIGGNGLVNVAQINPIVSLNRTNNTPAAIIPNMSVAIIEPHTPGSVTGNIGPQVLRPLVYTTLNSDDNINLYGYFTGAAGSGTVEATLASIVAVKLY